MQDCGSACSVPLHHYKEYMEDKGKTFEERAANLKCVVLNERQVCDLELLVNGGFDPLQGFMAEHDYVSCVENMRLANGSLWSMPITLCIDEKQKEELIHCDYVTLKHETGLPLAIMDIRGDKSIYKPDISKESEKVYGADDKNHPWVSILREYENQGKIYNMGGVFMEAKLPPHYDFCEHRLQPIETKAFFKAKGWTKVVGFQTRNPMHRSHYELTQYAMKMAGEDAKLLLHPVVGMTQNCDVNYHTRVKCYKELMKSYDKDSAKLSLLPLAMRMAGPREALWHAQIRKNYGCTHFVVGRDHAGPSYKREDGSDFYGPYDAQTLLMEYADEIGIVPIVSKLIVYTLPKDCKDEMAGTYMPIDEVNKDSHDIKNISGTQQREMLKTGTPIPEWFTFPNVAKILYDSYKPMNQQGFTLYFVGLSGSGKSTVANFVMSKIRELSYRNITYLDGDIVRQHLSQGLGFSVKDRSINIRRIGYICSEVTRHGGVAVAANIAPFEDDRLYNRELISAQGKYIEVYVKTDLEECEKRDVKGLYALARQGKIEEFTGISSPFEEPKHAEIVLNGSEPIEHNVWEIIEYLQDKGLL